MHPCLPDFASACPLAPEPYMLVCMHGLCQLACMTIAACLVYAMLCKFPAQWIGAARMHACIACILAQHLIKVQPLWLLHAEWHSR